MRLLVSVSSTADASAALAGGADVIDAKDPLRGALGAVSLLTLGEIHALVGGACPVTAALGDGCHEDAIEDAARMFTEAGTALVKVGFAGTTRLAQVGALIAAAVRGAGPGGGVVAVAYADAHAAEGPDPISLVGTAARAGAAGILLDTFDKDGPGVREIVTPHALVAWVAAAHGSGLLVAVAGRLTDRDLPFIRDAGADIAGVRGAACVGGRSGRISADSVRRLRAQVAAPSRSALSNAMC